MFGGSDANEPINMMKSGMILVTFNYRLGPLGFMSTQDEVMPGNLGLKDQALALKWVNKNIGNFQGDIKRITVVGFSAGGASTHLFYMSPLTKNLFKNGISHSGCALNPWVVQENAREKAHKIAAHLKCPTDDHEAMLKCLKNQPAGDIVSSVALFLAYLYNPFSPFGVVVEPPSEHAFLLDFPSKLLEKGEIYKAPWIASATTDEGLYPAAEFVSKEQYLPEIAKNWSTLAQHILDFNGTFIQQSEKTKIAADIKKQYFENRPMTPKNFHDLTRVRRIYSLIRLLLILIKSNFQKKLQMVSDRLYHYGISKAVQLQSTISPTYFYFFQFKSQFALGEMLSGGRTDLGIAHGEDVFLVFPVAERQKIPFNDEETSLEFKLMEMYIKFANKNEARFGGLAITPVQGKAIHHMDILSSTQFGMKIFKEDHYGNQKFWDMLINFHLEN